MAGPTPPPRGKAGIALRAAPSASPAKGRLPSRSPSRQPKKEAESQPLPKPAPKGPLPPVGATIRFTYDQKERVGVVGYAGTTDFAAGEWIGVVVDQPWAKNDGSVKEKRYFTCAPQHGLFIRTHMVLELVKLPGADTEESLSVASTTASGVTAFPDGMPTPVSLSSDRKQSDEEVETSNLQQSIANSSAEGTADVRAGLEAMRIELEARYSGRESELREEAAAGLRSLEVEEAWARDAVTSERQEAAEAKVALADARAETAAALAEADRAWEAVEASGARAKRAAQAYEEDLQVQADQRQQLEVLASMLRRGQDSCLQSLDEHCGRWQRELAEAQEACELAEERAAALSMDHGPGYAKDWEDPPARQNDWQVPLTGDEDSQALARLEASAAASLACAERAISLQAAEAVEERIEDVETQAAASKQALVVMLAEEASASMEANIAEVEEVVEAAHERVMNEVMQAKDEAAQTAEVRRVSLQREEQAHALTMNQLMVTRQALLDGRQAFEQNSQLQAEEGEDLRGRELEEAALAQAASERAVALGEAASACEERLAELEARVSTSETAEARLQALEAEVRQVRQELERREAELNVAAKECLGQRLQIAELGKEVARQKSVNSQVQAEGDIDRDRGILLRRRSENDKDRHTNGGGILDLACCYGGRVRQPQR